MNERRFETRLLCAQLARVEWTIGQDRFRTAEALLEDISPLGGCVQVESPIPVGTPIEMSFDSSDGTAGRFQGRVCYCAYRDIGYFVGVRFSGQHGWSSDMAVPEHLLNLDSLSPN